MKKHALILAAAACAALSVPAGAAAADELPLALPLTVPQVSKGSFQDADRVLEPASPASR
ncbi:hypothetical protein ACH4SP_37305 [Streptomyces sp. NPDC021093]|uniref:hypothetical protein n=1 Tax=Streptomyces sp. NPDC021093 TaxID=3365112 RepID=UPI0037B77D6B